MMCVGRSGMGEAKDLHVGGWKRRQKEGGWEGGTHIR